MTSPGVLSLRCPACGRPFLSLPQQAGAFVTCPHCAQSAPMTLFGAPQAATATALPMQRRVARLPDAAPASWGTPSPAPYLTSQPAPYLPQQPTSYMPPSAGFPPPRAPAGPAPWPPAPESTPMFTPAAAGHFPPAPAYETPWPSAPTPTPFSIAAPVSAAPVTTMFGIAEQQPWQPLEAAPPPRAAAPLDWAAMRESPAIDTDTLEAWSPQQQRSIWPALVFLFLVVAGCVWILRDDLLPPMVVEIPVAKPGSTAPEKASDPVVVPTPEPAILPLPEPAPEIRRAEVPKPRLDLVAAGESGPRLFLDLIEAATPEARAALISQPEEHGADVEEFFAAGKPELLSFKPANATPQTLPGHDAVPLFQVTTKANPHGALLRLVPQKDETFLLDWPLFAETHQRRLGVFLESKPAEPAWFQVSLRRSHALELPEAMRSEHVAFTLQGSADSSVSCQGIAPKVTPIGRFLNRETEWSTIYIARLLLQHSKLADGTPGVLILDCEGAATAE